MKKLLFVIFFSFLYPAVLAQNSAFTYQGVLMDSGQPANGVYRFRFTLKDAATNGSTVAGPLGSGPTVVSNGLFMSTLDFGQTAFTGAPLWLDITVRTNSDLLSDAVLLPRQRVSGAPSALIANRALTANDVIGGGSGLTNIPGSAIQAGSIQSNQLSAATWQAATATPTNAIQAIGDVRYANFNLGRGWTTPYDCGAVGDGIADDTEAMQAWLNNATGSNLVAFLPPATGPYYKITESLWVTKANGLRLVGAGGEFHTTGIALGRAHIRQFTPGKHGIAIANSPAGVLTDSVHIEGICLSTETFSTNGYGIAFLGTNPDTDCNVIQECGVQGFGAGLYLGSVANLTVISCSLGKNGDGILMPATDAANHPAVINSIKLQTCQLSYNYSNQVHVTGGSLVLDTCDLASGAYGDIDKSSVGLRVEEHGFVDARWCNFENYSTNPAVLITCAPHNFGSAFIRLWGGQIGRSCAGCPLPNTYSAVVTNAVIYFQDVGLHSLASDGFAVLEANNYSGNPECRSTYMLAEKFIVNSVVYTHYAGPFATAFGTYGPMVPGEVKVTRNFNQDMGLLFAALLPGFYGPGVRQYDLLQYQKDKASTAGFSSLRVTNSLQVGAVSWTSGTGSPEGIIVAPVGSLYTRTDGGGPVLYVKETGSGETGWVAK
jgi:hypothetical protein